MTTPLLLVNDPVTLQNVFKVSGAPTDPSTITLVVTSPAGVASSYTYADGQITRSSIGTFTKDIVADSAGIWHYVWTGTGTAQDVADGSFTVFAAADRTLYCTVEELKDYLTSPPSGINFDPQLVMAARAASRAVDSYCSRRFWIDATAVARTFDPHGLYTLNLAADIGSTTGLVVATDNDGDGLYETTWADTDYQLLPTNAPYASPQAEPWTKIKAIGRYVFPTVYSRSVTRTDRIQITAKWGWPSVPDAVRQATLIKASRLFHRRNSPQGIAAFDDFGPVRINRSEDGDVVLLLEDYVRSDAVMMA